jgi:hypothetical protein
MFESTSSVEASSRRQFSMTIDSRLCRAREAHWLAANAPNQEHLLWCVTSCFSPTHQRTPLIRPHLDAPRLQKTNQYDIKMMSLRCYQGPSLVRRPIRRRRQIGGKLFKDSFFGTFQRSLTFARRNATNHGIGSTPTVLICRTTNPCQTTSPEFTSKFERFDRYFTASRFVFFFSSATLLISLCVLEDDVRPRTQMARSSQCF